VVASRSPHGGARPRRKVSIPFIAGQWSLRARRMAARGRGGRSQSPSLRGSGHFRARRLENQLEALVSIPFIAGQWSLPGGSGSPPRRTRRVSIPFIAGQWSLRGLQCVQDADLPGFQSPSLRGSGRFARAVVQDAGTTTGGFNPLHCGAVVASGGARPIRAGKTPFQSPSLRGSGRFAGPRRKPKRAARFQSPSLRGSGRFNPAHKGEGGRTAGFNPLHCGAVVASLCHVWLLRWRCTCFNPLHCGAVVASFIGKGGTRCSRFVSIPFIAGQWSLREDARAGRTTGSSFNPLHCGAVVASKGGKKCSYRH